MSISAAQVKELRERTGAGMMECKKALVETGGDVEAAIEAMRKSGLAKADKKAGRVAAEGRIVASVAADGKSAAIVEVNCETDFVARGDDFAGFATRVAELVRDNAPESLEALMALPFEGGKSLDEAQREMVARIGEKISVRRFQIVTSEERLGHYLHGTRIGVVAALTGGTDELAKDIAMHVAATNPQYIADGDVPAEQVEKERGILSEQALAEGKPEEIVKKMVEGRLRKYFAEITLVGQPFVKNDDVTVGKLLSSEGAAVTAFARFEVGEGIERKEENFVEEVMAQVRGG